MQTARSVFFLTLVVFAFAVPDPPLAQAPWLKPFRFETVQAQPLVELGLSGPCSHLDLFWFYGTLQVLVAFRGFWLFGLVFSLLVMSSRPSTTESASARRRRQRRQAFFRAGAAAAPAAGASGNLAAAAAGTAAFSAAGTASAALHTRSQPRSTPHEVSAVLTTAGLGSCALAIIDEFGIEVLTDLQLISMFDVCNSSLKPVQKHKLHLFLHALSGFSVPLGQPLHSGIITEASTQTTQTEAQGIVAGFFGVWNDDARKHHVDLEFQHPSPIVAGGFHEIADVDAQTDARKQHVVTQFQHPSPVVAGGLHELSHVDAEVAAFDAREQHVDMQFQHPSPVVAGSSHALKHIDAEVAAPKQHDDMQLQRSLELSNESHLVARTVGAAARSQSGQCGREFWDTYALIQTVKALRPPLAETWRVGLSVPPGQDSLAIVHIGYPFPPKDRRPCEHGDKCFCCLHRHRPWLIPRSRGDSKVGGAAPGAPQRVAAQGPADVNGGEEDEENHGFDLFA